MEDDNDDIDLSRMTITPEQVQILADAPKARRPPKKSQKAFALVDLEWPAGAAKAAGCPCATVLVALRYSAWKKDSRSFVFPNALLRRLGVNRHVKYRTLEHLQATGWALVEKRGRGRAPIVTLLDDFHRQG